MKLLTKFKFRTISAILLASLTHYAQSETIVIPVPSWDRPPFTYYDNDGNIQGIDIAILEEVSKRLDLEAEFRMYSFEGRQNAFLSGQVYFDCCVNPAWRNSPEDKEVQLFAEPIYHSVNVFIFPKNKRISIDSEFSQLKDLRVATIKGFSYISQSHFGKRVDYSSVEKILEAVHSGDVDVGITDRHSAGYIIEKNDFNVDFGAIESKMDVGVRIHKNKAELLEQLNLVIGQMKDEGVIKQIIKHEVKKAKSNI